MFYEFKQAVRFNGKDYLRGVHEVPEKVEFDPHFLKFVSLGLIVESSDPSAEVKHDAKDHAKRLHETLLARAAQAKGIKRKPAPEPEKPVEEAQMEAPKPESVVEAPPLEDPKPEPKPEAPKPEKLSKKKKG